METTPETRMAVQMVTANSRNMRPSMPLMNRIGMKTAASEMVIERMVNPISLDPLKAAAMGLRPLSMWRTVFSSMTMASSTTKHTERISAIIDSVLRLKPSSAITTSVPRIENGSASAGISVARPLRRNAKITITTSSSVNPMVRWKSLNASRIVLEWSPRAVR